MEQIKMVTLPLAEYNELIEDSIKLKMLVAACYGNVDLRYDGALRFDEDSLNLALKTVDGARYRECKNILTKEAEA